MRGSPAAIRIRPATQMDVDGLRDLAAAIWREYYPPIIGRDQVEYMLATMYDVDTVRGEVAGGVVWELAFLPVDGSRTAPTDEAAPRVPDAAGDAVGYLSYSYDRDEDVVTLHKLYLLPRLHGRGIGKHLMAHVIRAAERRRARLIRLQVNKANTRAVRAYERAGFRIVESVVRPIGGGYVMDDYVMALALTPLTPGGGG